MKRWLAVLVIMGFHPAAAQEARLTVDRANELYRAGEYQKALELYDRLVENQYESPVLYYNLGNTNFKLQNIPAAIVNYERALRLAPHDDDIAYNLAIANLRVVDKIEPVPRLFLEDWWAALMGLLPSDKWAVVLIVSLWCAAILGAAFLSLRSAVFRRIAFFSAAAALLVCLLAALGTVQQNRRENSQDRAIVFSSTAAVKSAPDANSTDLFVLHEGVKVEILDAVGYWKKIRLADGKIGWISTETIRVI